jgi:hypothetical protein
MGEFNFILTFRSQVAFTLILSIILFTIQLLNDTLFLLSYLMIFAFIALIFWQMSRLREDFKTGIVFTTRKLIRLVAVSCLLLFVFLWLNYILDNDYFFIIIAIVIMVEATIEELRSIAAKQSQGFQHHNLP